jgi:murein DD-endopeptidase MepM/ murein hydrolase activator NlpD
MVVDELMVEGEVQRLGAPVAVRFTNKDEEFVAIRYTTKDGYPRYYDASGKSRKRPFLRSPLKFSRVTSGFNRNRYHPVLKRRRPHNGVDFGAPTGTPIQAVGDAVVTWAGPNGGHGRFVKLNHEGPYESSYSHLSRISVRKGQRVRQGDIIGYVGSTGLATGPHLHYQFWVDKKIRQPADRAAAQGW